jgi:NAD(P)-dependent dehydrogenase (short-subunit alcohol dehydrogenase family)
MATSTGPLLEGKVGIVTGGGGGLGRGIGQAFAAQGAAVVIAEIDHDRAASAVAEISDAGGQATAVVVDVVDPLAPGQVVSTALATYGQIDVLVNNVGHYLFPGKPFYESTEEEWDALYRINVLHVLRMTRAALAPMIERNAGGSIINLSTVEAFRGIPHQAVYGAFKAAVAHFSTCLALDVGRYNIRVNGIAPDVSRSEQLPYDRWLRPEDWEKVPDWVPLGRLGAPDDAGAVAVFLASDLSSFVTGDTIHLDGGTRAAGGWYRSRRRDGGWTNRPYDA